MAINPEFASVAIAPTLSQLTAANLLRDGTGTTVAIATGTANGIVIERLTVQATGTTTAGMIRFFMSTDNGTTKRLMDEEVVNAITASATVPVFVMEIAKFKGTVLRGTTNILYASTNNAETFNVIVETAGL